MYFSWSVKVTKIKLKGKKKSHLFPLTIQTTPFFNNQYDSSNYLFIAKLTSCLWSSSLTRKYQATFLCVNKCPVSAQQICQVYGGSSEGKISLNCQSVASGKKKSTDLVSSMKNKSSSSRKKECKKCYKERCCFSFEILTKSWIIWRQGGKRIKHRGKQFGLNYFFQEPSYHISFMISI